jgi:hypothetical protein
MYDATQGANSGAHISVLTRSGGNGLHGEVYEKFQNSDMNAAAVLLQCLAHPGAQFPEPQSIRRHLGGPIKKDKLFYFLSYQGVRIADSTDSTKEVTVPLSLTNDRSAQGIINTIQGAYGKTSRPASSARRRWPLLQPRAPTANI